ncbi:hypothetical protein [Anaerosinus massiliensis]|uniref:hypothetical protein n=1 Tax=Massilibacillus massiliensis TaxID=1806837 RepID=UPI000DA5FD6A|nr:hypothetical protein [Massilibacillus massiliensis]
MCESRFTLTVYIAPPFTSESNVGHMWISLDDNEEGLKEHYGFHPKEDGKAYSDVGRVATDDGIKYTILSTRQSFPLTEETYHNVHAYCQSTIYGTFGPYLAVGNACVNYAWDIMQAAGIGNEGLNALGFVIETDDPRGAVWPTFNQKKLNMVHDYYMAEWNGEDPQTVGEFIMDKMKVW